MRRAAVGDDLLGHLLGALGVDVGDDDGRALARQRLGVCLADAATGAGDDGDFIFEPHAYPLRVKLERFRPLSQ